MNLEARHKKDLRSRKRHAQTDKNNFATAWPLLKELQIDSLDALESFNKQITESEKEDFNSEKKTEYVSNNQSSICLIFLCNSYRVQRR